MPTFLWNSSASTPSATTTFKTDSLARTNSVTNVPSGRAAFQHSNGASASPGPIYIRSAKMYLAGRDANRTASIIVGSATSSNFTITQATSASDVGFKTVDLKVAAGTSTITMGFNSNGASFFGRWGVTADSNTLWGQCDYDEVPTAPRSVSSSNITSSGFRVSWSAPSSSGDSPVSTYILHLSTSSSFGSYSTHTTSSTLFEFGASQGISANTTYFVRVFAGNDIYAEFSTRSSSVASSTVSATTPSAFDSPVITDGVSNQSYRVGDSVFEYVAASNTYSSYGQGGTNFTLSTSIPGIFLIDYGNFAYIQGTVGNIATGSYGVSVTAYGPGGTASANGTWSISQALPSWTDDTLASGRVGASYNSTISANNTSYWIITNIPPGLSATGTSGTTATIAGTPTTAGFYTVSATPYNTDNASGGTRNISLYVAPRIPQWVDTTISTSARVGVSYSDTISANFVSYWTDGALPLNGISFSGQTNVSGLATGTISGTPTNFGTINFTITPYNSDNETPGGQALSISILDGSLSWADQTLATTTVTEGQSYSDGVFVNAGPVSVTYTVASGHSLPSGLSLNSSSGAITGTPNTPGSYTFRVTATNGSSETITTADLTLVVEAAGGFVRVWNGTAWVDAVAYVRTSSNTWAEGTVQVRSGGAWTTSFTD